MHYGNLDFGSSLCFLIVFDETGHPEVPQQLMKLCSSKEASSFDTSGTKFSKTQCNCFMIS